MPAFEKIHEIQTHMFMADYILKRQRYSSALPFKGLGSVRVKIKKKKLTFNQQGCIKFSNSDSTGVL